MAPTARLQVVLSRFNGDKRVASQPYVVVTVANGARKVLRVGAEVPIAGVAAGTKESPSYKSVGTNIRAEVTLYDDGRYLVSVNVESSSPYADAQEKAGRPAFRNYSLDGMAYLKDGQTAEDRDGHRQPHGRGDQAGGHPHRRQVNDRLPDSD